MPRDLYVNNYYANMTIKNRPQRLKKKKQLAQVHGNLFNKVISLSRWCDTAIKLFIFYLNIKDVDNFDDSIL